jgi:hypothetical protein
MFTGGAFLVFGVFFAPPLEVKVRAAGPVQAGEVAEAVVVHRNIGTEPLTLYTGGACGEAEPDTITVDGVDARIASVSSCEPATTPSVMTLRPGQRWETTVAFQATAGATRLGAVYRADPAPPGAFAGVVSAAPVPLKVRPADPPGPVVTLVLPRKIRAGKPFTVRVVHRNLGMRGWILFNEKCGGPPRDFVVVDAVEQGVPTVARCREWDNRMSLEPGRRFETRYTLVLDAGRHTLQAKYRVGDAYAAAVVWKGEAVSPVVEVDVAPP